MLTVALGASSSASPAMWIVSPWIFTWDDSARALPVTVALLSHSGRISVMLPLPSVTFPVSVGTSLFVCPGICTTTAPVLASRSIRPFRVTDVVLSIAPSCCTEAPVIVTSASGAWISPAFVTVPPPLPM